MSLDQSRLGVLEAEFDQVVQGRTAAVGDSKAGVGNGVSPRTWRDETLGERERRFRELLEAFPPPFTPPMPPDGLRSTTKPPPSFGSPARVGQSMSSSWD